MRIEELTVFRFLAAAIVVTFHFGSENLGLEGILVAGSQMVTFFFVLSGYVMGLSYYDKNIQKKEYYWARLARIMPVYILALALMVLARLVYGEPVGYVPLMLNALLLQAWISPYPLSINAPGWSLSVEAFFYLSFPFILDFVKSKRLSVSWLLILSFLVWLFTQVILCVMLQDRYYGGYPSFSHDMIYYFPLSHFCSFLLGVASAIWIKKLHGVTINNLAGVTLTALAIVMIVLSINNQSLISNYAGLNFAYGSSFFAPLFVLLIVAISVCRGGALRFLGAKPLVLLGDASYSMYILQFPVYLAFEHYIIVHFTVSPSAEFFAYFIVLTLVSILCFEFYEKFANRHLRSMLRTTSVRQGAVEA